ncbi:MAG TPA: response regulator [Bryobacteraceae bacterium]|nr:response regulator [Bryobacteraceae bacterium]
MSAARILLVDDEVPLLQLLEKYLQRLGHQVTTQSKSEDALRSFQAAPDAYDLVIADLGMPDMPGDTMLRRMLAIRQDVPILICSGSPFFVSSLPRVLEKQVAFLQKPFAPKMLSEAIDRLLSHR